MDMEKVGKSMGKHSYYKDQRMSSCSKGTELLMFTQETGEGVS